ncbi:MAG TPA: hypothetical protein VGD31_15655 [Sphingobacteriaceae bacterium]
MTSNDEETTHNVQVTISSLGNERRTIRFDSMTDEKIKVLIEEVRLSFGTVRVSNALLLSGSDGVVVFANLDNVAFVEVHIV